MTFFDLQTVSWYTYSDGSTEISVGFPQRAVAVAVHIHTSSMPVGFSRIAEFIPESNRTWDSHTHTLTLLPTSPARF